MGVQLFKKRLVYSVALPIMAVRKFYFKCAEVVSLFKRKHKCLCVTMCSLVMSPF